MFSTFLIDAAYFVAAFLFLYGLKRMASPVTARSGIVVAGGGMVLAVAAAFLYGFDVSARAEPYLTTNVILLVIALGLGIGWAWISGKRVAMTDMPQMVALYNGMGGGGARPGCDRAGNPRRSDWCGCTVRLADCLGQA